MDKIDKGLAWAGLAFGGGLSIAGNVRAASLPGLPADLDAASLDAWRGMAEAEPSGTALVIAVAFPVAAVLLVEMFNRWTWMNVALRRAAIGTVALIAALMSWVHLFTVLLWEGNPLALAGLGPLVPDVIAIVSAVALLSSHRTSDKQDSARTLDKVDDLIFNDGHYGRPDMSSPDSLDRVPDTWTPDSVDTQDNPAPPDVVDTRTQDAPDTEPEPAALDIPAPRRTRTKVDPMWKIKALDIMTADPSLSDAEVAAKVLADLPGAWPSAEAGRKAVWRVRQTV
jgi:hypothetical protein